MRNTLSDLNNYLFEEIERLKDDDLSEEQLEKELKRAKSITGVADKTIHNGELAFRMMRFMEEYGSTGGANVPGMRKNSCLRRLSNEARRGGLKKEIIHRMRCQ